jgi:two-component system cell cycle sensor histidine kinase/response regulator CckA
VVAALCIVVTAVAAMYARSEIKAQAAQQARDHTRFAGIVDVLTDHMDARMQRINAVLQAGAAIAPGADSIHAARFANWAQSFDTTADFRGFGPIQFSSKSQQDLSEQLLGDSTSHTTIQNDMDGAADSTYLVSTTAAGYGVPKQQYVVLAPVRSGDALSIPDGFVYARLDVDEFMLSELARAPHAGIRVRLYHNADTAVTNLAYDSDHRSTGAPFKSSYREDHRIDVFGAPWAVTIEASAESGLAESVNPVPTVIAAGAVFTLLMFGATMARAHTQAAAHETEQRYDDLFNGTPIPMWVYDAKTLIVRAVNDAAIAQYGYTRSEFLALHIKELRPPADAAAAIAYIDRMPLSYHNAGIWTHRRKDGTDFKVETAAHSVFFEGRQGTVVVANDISERLRAEADLKDSEERLRQMADHINEAFYVVDLRSATTLYISPTWAEIWGRPITDGYDSSIWFAAIHPDDRAALTANQRLIAAGESVTDTFRVIRPDTTTRWVRSRTFPVRNAAGEVYRMVGVAVDITEMRVVEARFAQAQKMDAIGRLAGGVAHDFNNLLTVILGEADQLKESVLAGTPGNASVVEIQHAGERAAVLTRQLLAFSRRQLVEPTVFDLTETVTGMSNMCRRLIGEDIELITRLAADTWNARADSGQIEQVLANLVVNARDAMPNGGQLTIRTANVTLDEEHANAMPESKPGDYVTMVVSDTGMGMTEAVRARLFEPFFTTKEAGKGTGLGLATCYGIVKQAEGHMTVYSEPGLGTTVTVYLPRGFAATTLAKSVEPVALPRGTETILLVEDEPAVRRVAVRLLTAQGYQLLEAENGAEAARISAGHEGTIHLLLTDVVLPGIGGREIAEQTRAQRPDIKVLFASGYTDDVILQHRLLHHDVALLQKPFSRESIARKVREVLDAA